MRKLFSLIFFISIFVVIAYASDIAADKQCGLALYIIKNSDTDQVSYKLIDKERSLVSIISILKETVAHDDKQMLEIIAYDKVEINELNKILVELKQIGWRNVRLNGLLNGQLTDLAYRGQSLVPGESDNTHINPLPNVKKP
ncbi:MAG: hypothetical protein WC708_07360 [Lentisphaeria bacterium]